MTADEAERADLHLPDLKIEGFRGIGELSIPRLARVTLLAGKNGVGKTTVLEAIRVYAARGRAPIIEEILLGREEIAPYVDEYEGEFMGPDLAALFHGRDDSWKYPNMEDETYKIGIASGNNRLTIDPFFHIDEERHTTIALEKLDSIRVKYGNLAKTVPSHFFVKRTPKSPSDLIRLLQDMTNESLHEERWSEIGSEALGPDPLDNGRIAEFWDRVVLTEEEDIIAQNLRPVIGEHIERIALTAPRNWTGRRAIVKIKGQARPVPLKSCGEGAVRFFGTGLAMANVGGGILLIDEAENGLHWSVQSDFWRMVLLGAKVNKVQVFATTHSWDCITGFARAINETPGTDGMLVRLDRDGGRIRAVDYTEEDLAVAAKQRIEVR